MSHNAAIRNGPQQQPAANSHQEPILLNLGRSFVVNLGLLCEGTAGYTIEQLMAALEATCTLGVLMITHFVRYQSTPENNRRWIQPLCQCIANLHRRRSHNEKPHPLSKLILGGYGDMNRETTSVLQQFLTAAQEGNIGQLKIETVHYLSVEVLLDFGRNHKKLEILELWNVSLMDTRHHASKKHHPHKNDEEEDVAVHSSSLERMTLRDIRFESTRAASLFEDWVEDLTQLSCLELGQITIWNRDDGSGDEDDLDDDAYNHTNSEEDEPEEKEDDDDDDDKEQEGKRVHGKKGKIIKCNRYSAEEQAERDKWGIMSDHDYVVNSSSDDHATTDDEEEEEDIPAVKNKEMKRTGQEPQGKGTDRDPNNTGNEDEDNVDADDEDEYDEDEYDEYDFDDHPRDPEMLVRIVKKLMKPSVGQLSLTRLCRQEHFKVAMKAGKSSVVNLWVAVQRHKHTKLTILARMIRGAVKLNKVTLRNLARSPWLRPERAFFQRVAASSTLTRMELVRMHSKAAARLQGIATRNSELARFVASPSTYPIDTLLSLVNQFSNDHCPTGLYLLARSFPEVIAFDKIQSKDSAATETKLKNRKV